MEAMSPVLLLTVEYCHSSRPSWLLVSISFIAIIMPIIHLELIHAVVPTSPFNPNVSSTVNQPSSSSITLQWDPPSSTGGVSVSYVLIISPTPLSGSPVTVETTSAQITVSYNTPYNVTIRAVNCAGMSQESSIVDLSKLGDAVIERDSFQCNSQTTSMHVFLLLCSCVPPTVCCCWYDHHQHTSCHYWWIHADLHLQWRQ